MDGNESGDAAEGNVVSGNLGSGISINNAGSGNVVAGNRVGTNPAGTAAIANAGRGVWVGNSPNTRVGTDGDAKSDALEGNLISGNGQDGVTIASSANAVVAGNLVGVNVDGSAAGQRWRVASGVAQRTPASHERRWNLTPRAKLISGTGATAQTRRCRHQ